ncbi:MAG: amidohydrolase family protein [Acidimicrobiia bacterium]|nr:amidohydrolase family protein [Acidimicrobiia bacterium]
MTPTEILAAWHEAAVAAAPIDLEVWDAHSHTGEHDPDGFVLDDDALLGALGAAGHAGAVVTSNANPGGYVEANDRILAEAEASAGRLVPFCRVDPKDDGAVAELQRSLDKGHRGIKLHPRAEAFAMADAGVAGVAAVAAERGVPILVHAGRGIPAMGPATVALLEANHGLNIVLAHCGISDLSGLGPIAAEVPGLYFDTSWWDVTDRLALHGWVPPHRIVYASDTPYGWPDLSFVMTLRAARTSGYGERQLRGLFGGSLLALLDGSTPPDLGPAAGTNRIVADPGLIRAHASTHGALTSVFAHADMTEPLSLARLACDVPPGTPHEAVFRAIKATLDAVDEAQDRRMEVALLITASGAALTPEVDLPDLSG